MNSLKNKYTMNYILYNVINIIPTTRSWVTTFHKCFTKTTPIIINDTADKVEIINDYNNKKTKTYK